MSMLEVQHLSKHYDGRVAVEDLSFQLAQGEILGFLGLNGAGKSTTMRMLTGFLSPTSGVITIGENAMSMAPQKAKRLLGYLPETPPLYAEMTVQGFLEFVARLKDTPPSKLKEEVSRVCEVTQISDVNHRLIGNLSRGFRQRVGLAQALLNSPPVLILDEPTEGLDPRQRADMLKLIRSLVPRQSIILSTHVLSEVEAICDRVLIIHQGKKVALETVEALSRQHRNLEEAFFQATRI